MPERFCVPCHRALAPDELAHLHATWFYDMDSSRVWSEYPSLAMRTYFTQWLREVHQVQLMNSALPFLPPGVQDHQRLVDATEALRLALGLPHVRSLLDLLDAVLARLGEVSGSGSRVPRSQPATTNQQPETAL